MKRTQEALGNLVNYKVVSGIRPLEPPKIEKKDIPQFILCQNFDKAMQKVERTMERYDNKVNELQARLQQSQNDIEAQKETLKRVDPGQGYFVDRRDPQAVARYNDRLEQARRLTERINDAIDKHQDLIARHNDAVREAEEKLEELTQEAKLVIDDDIVAFLDKCTQTATKLSGSENSEDLVAAIETSFIGLKISNSFEEHIEGNVARKDARERVSEISNLFAKLCANEEARNYLADLFRRNAYLIEKNAELYSQVAEVIEGVDQKELSSMTGSLQQALGEEFKTDFKYEGIIDPSKLEAVVVDIHKTIDAINANIAKVKELNDSTKATAEAGVNAHKNAESLLANMNTNVEAMRDDLLFKGHFACDMLDEAVIEDFYHKDLRPAGTALREHLVSLIGEEQIDALVMEKEDRYSIGKAETAIKRADLLRLQSQRDKVHGHIGKLSDMIKKAEADIQKAGEVPRKNADEFRSSASTLYVLSHFPVFGFAFALGILGKIKKFAPGFSSTNEIYRKLGAETLAKNKTMQTVSLILAGVLGIGGMIIFLAVPITTEVAANVGIPGAVLVFYLITWAILGGAGKKLQSYIGVLKAAPQPTTAEGTK
jgi:glutaredoxin 2